MYIIQDAYSYYFAAVYFTLCVIICAYFLLNLTVAVMLSNFTKMQNTDEKLMEQYEQLFDKKNIDVQSKRKELRERQIKKQTSKNIEKLSVRALIGSFYHQFIYTHIEIPESSYYKKKVTRFCYLLVEMKWF